MRKALFVGAVLTLATGLGGGAASASADLPLGVAISVPSVRLLVRAPFVYASVLPYYGCPWPYDLYTVAPSGLGYGFRPKYYGWHRGPYFIRRAWR